MRWRADPVLRHPQIGIARGSHAQAQQPGGLDSRGVALGNGIVEEHEVLGSGPPCLVISVYCEVIAREI